MHTEFFYFLQANTIRKKTFQAATVNLHQQKKYSDLLQSQLISFLSSLNM